MSGFRDSWFRVRGSGFSRFGVSVGVSGRALAFPVRGFLLGV